MAIYKQYVSMQETSYGSDYYSESSEFTMDVDGLYAMINEQNAEWNKMIKSLGCDTVNEAVLLEGGDFKQWLKNAWEKIKEMWRKFIGMIKSLFATIKKKIVALIDKIRGKKSSNTDTKSDKPTTGASTSSSSSDSNSSGGTITSRPSGGAVVPRSSGGAVVPYGSSSDDEQIFHNFKNLKLPKEEIKEVNDTLDDVDISYAIENGIDEAMKAPILRIINKLGMTEPNAEQYYNYLIGDEVKALPFSENEMENMAKKLRNEIDMLDSELKDGDALRDGFLRDIQGSVDKKELTETQAKEILSGYNYIMTTCKILSSGYTRAAKRCIDEITITFMAANLNR